MKARILALETLLVDRDMRAVEAFYSLRSDLAAFGMPIELARMQACMDRLDFDAARECLLDIGRALDTP